jgi:hypothetical protein
VALFALVFQISAFDHHLQGSSNRSFGLPGTAKHEVHCHGDSHGCANGGQDMPMTANAGALTLVPGLSPFFTPVLAGAAVPAEAAPAIEKEPPRA